jgi:LmbE family N-acetylglucosaminyl deacetylase
MKRGRIDFPRATIRAAAARLALAAGLVGVCFRSTSVGAQVRVISNSPTKRSVFLVAHQDDWQVFMGDAVSGILKGGSPATFIYLTAGDDGRDSVYWQTRERAALRSTAVAMGEVVPDAQGIQCATIPVVKHAVRKCSLGSTESYFLRLPDGNRNGAGFARYNHQSLRLLRAKRISSVTAVDGSATYQGWPDLVATIGELAGGTGGDVLIHTTDPSIAANPHDHFDHRMAGFLVEDLRKQRMTGARYYEGYALATRAPNRSNAESRVKTAIFLAYDSEMKRVNKDWSAYREHPAFYSQCMERTYARAARPR